MVEVDVLRYFGAETQLKRKWMRMWDNLGKRLLRMPKWMQELFWKTLTQPLEID